MNPNWAEENLQTIRTLMERSALYRRALAPILLFAGIIGLAGTGLGLIFHLDRGWHFCGLWIGAAVLAIAGAFTIARRQALRDSETFWSPPTRRIAQALAPPFTAGLFFGVLMTGLPDHQEVAVITSLLWVLFYGCAVHAAGFFMPRGMKLFGWLFIVCACGLFSELLLRSQQLELNPHFVMGFFFGGLHLAYGVYLYLTEKKTPNA